MMDDLITHHLLFHAEVVTPLELDEYSGAALRGHLYEAVWRRFCTNRVARSCAECPLNALCPVSALVAPLREENTRGRDIPRPYLMLPPLKGARALAPGEKLTFGLTLFGSIIELLPYILLSLPTLETVGLGKRGQDGRRGQFKVKRVESYHPLSGERQSIYEAGKAQVQAATLSVTAADVQAKAAALAKDRITLNFLTPTRIKDQERPVGRAEFRPLMHRLLERLSALRVAYGDGQEQSYEERKQVVDLAQHVRCLDDATYWERRSLRHYQLDEGERFFHLSLRSETLGLTGSLDLAIATPARTFVYSLPPMPCCWKKPGTCLSGVATSTRCPSSERRRSQSPRRCAKKLPRPSLLFVAR